MKKWIKRGLCLLLCLTALVLCVSAASGPRVYFMAVNDTPLELTSAMPTRVGSVLYVPYYMFSATTTGVNLGVYATYNSARRQVLLYSSDKQLIFDLAANTAYDMDGNSYPNRGMVRGSTVFLPLAMVCSVFSELVGYSVSATPYGQLVRVKSASAVLDDASFIAAADSRLHSMYDRYILENPSVTRDPTPTPSQSLGQGAEVYLAFTLDSLQDRDPGALLSGVLDALERQSAQGLFLFTPEEIRSQDDLVRRLTGLGHLVGARLTAGQAEDALKQLDAARDALAAVSRSRLTTALCEGLDGEADLGTLSETGVVFWRTSVDGRDTEEPADALLHRFTGGEDAKNYLLLDAAAGSSLRGLLESVTRADFQLKAPVPTALVQKAGNT